MDLLLLTLPWCDCESCLIKVKLLVTDIKRPLSKKFTGFHWSHALPKKVKWVPNYKRNIKISCGFFEIIKCSKDFISIDSENWKHYQLINESFLRSSLNPATQEFHYSTIPFSLAGFLSITNQFWFRQEFQLKRIS